MRMKCDCGGKYDSTENNSLLKVISVHKRDTEKSNEKRSLDVNVRGCHEQRRMNVRKLRGGHRFDYIHDRVITKR